MLLTDVHSFAVIVTETFLDRQFLKKLKTC